MWKITVFDPKGSIRLCGFPYASCLNSYSPLSSSGSGTDTAACWSGSALGRALLIALPARQDFSTAGGHMDSCFQSCRNRLRQVRLRHLSFQIRGLMIVSRRSAPD